MKPFQDLNSFIDDNDKFIDNWKQNCQVYDEYMIFDSALKKKVNMQYNELPEPYVGNPFKSLAVIININPGNACNQYTNTGGQNIIGKYSAFTQNFHYCNGGAGCQGGQQWWKKRMPWIKRMAEQFSNNVSGYPFALELCPWHSKSWGGMKRTGDVKEYVENRVLKPAVAALQHSCTKVVLVVGKAVYDELLACGCKDVHRWSHSNNNIAGWPTKATGGKIERTYALLSYEGAYLLCTWSRGGNSAPQDGFANVEKAIIDGIRNTYKIP